MSKYVPDILSRRWVILSPGRVQRPHDSEKKGKKNVCPFCKGNEALTTKELLRYEDDTEKKDWTLRVIENKYPITDYHEVIIHSPDHCLDLEVLPQNAVVDVLKAYKERFNFYRDKGQVMIFCNHGEHAGASLTHPHSQLVVIPFQINLDTLTREPINNNVFETTHFQAYCPDFSQWPYEVWLTPKRRETYFGDITEDEITDLSKALQRILQRIVTLYAEFEDKTTPFGYNFYIHPKADWYIRIIPRFVNRAGFELGTGLNVNIVDPADAAAQIRGVEDKVASIMERLKKECAVEK